MICEDWKEREIGGAVINGNTPARYVGCRQRRIDARNDRLANRPDARRAPAIERTTEDRLFGVGVARTRTQRETIDNLEIDITKDGESFLRKVVPPFGRRVGRKACISDILVRYAFRDVIVGIAATDHEVDPTISQFAGKPNFLVDRLDIGF